MPPQFYPCEVDVWDEDGERERISVGNVRAGNVTMATEYAIAIAEDRYPTATKIKIASVTDNYVMRKFFPGL